MQVPFGFYDEGVLMTRDLVPTEPKVQELKFYAPGVGLLLSVPTTLPGGRRCSSASPRAPSPEIRLYARAAAKPRPSGGRGAGGVTQGGE